MNTKDIIKVQKLLDEAFSTIEKDLKCPSRRREDNALDVPIQSTLILQKMLLERFGKKEELLLASLKEIMNVTLNYYNTLHGNRLGFYLKLKKKFFKLIA